MQKENNIIQSLKSIKKWLITTYRLPDKDYLFHNINRLIEKIDDIIPRLENIPILFQTGEDEEAMNIIKF